MKNCNCKDSIPVLSHPTLPEYSAVICKNCNMIVQKYDYPQVVKNTQKTFWDKVKNNETKENDDLQ